MQLHNWHSSSTSFRVRIALNLKGCEYENVPVSLRWENGDQDSPEYGAFNPQRNIPVLVEEGKRLVQSLAILEYLEETRPEPPLLPKSPAERARVRGLALFVTCEVQSLNNLRGQRQLAKMFSADQPALTRWQQHWIKTGFDALEAQLTAEQGTGRFCHGDAPTMADCFLVPQVYNALRPAVGAKLEDWPTIARIYQAGLALPAFDRALPTNQPGFESPVGH